MHWFTQQTSEVTSHAFTFVSRHSRHVYALYLDGLQARPRTRGQNGEDHLLGQMVYFIVFLFLHGTYDSAV